MKSQIEHIHIHSFHLISETFTIYLRFYMTKKIALNFCYYQSVYKLTNCTMPYSKANTLHVQGGGRREEGGGLGRGRMRVRES